jgi:hypothetical protein
VPRTFVSYSHDSNEHYDKVLALALQLRRDGFDGSIAAFKIMYRDEHGAWHAVRWDDEHASSPGAGWRITW